jgi:YHS domain-containing protein
MLKHKGILAAAALTAGVFAAGCGSEQQQVTTKDQTAKAQAKGPSGEYPIDWCVVSGEKLGSMGAPVTYTYQGRTIKFCCSGCIKEFEAQPARYLARLDSAAAGLIRSPSGS